MSERIRAGEERESGGDLLKASTWFYAQRAGGPGRTVPRGAYALARSQAAALPAAPGGKWVSLGPTAITGEELVRGNASGRVTSLAVSRAGTLFAGTAGGGVWSSADDGRSWAPLSDDQPSLAIGAVAIDPADSNIIYAATGEDNQGLDNLFGAGVLKSTDGGKSWTVLGREFFASRHCCAVAVGPADARVVYVAGDAGLYKSPDGGATWTQVLEQRVSSLVVGSTLFAAVPGVGIHKSEDGGATWERLAKGLPAPGSAFGETSLAMAPSDHQVLYAAIASQDQRTFGYLTGVYVTRDGGATWQELAGTPDYFSYKYFYGDGEGAQGWYDNVLAVSPSDPNRVVAGGIALLRSDDGGHTWTDLSRHYGLHPDQHALAFHPVTGALYIGNDGGVWALDAHGARNLNTNLAITQFYQGISQAGNGRTVAAGAQDNGTVQYTSGSTVWKEILGGDGGMTAIDMSHPGVLYAEVPEGGLHKSTTGGTHWTPAAPPPVRSGQEQAGWVAPFAMVPSSPGTLYFGGEHLYKTTDGAATWKRVFAAPDGSGVVTAVTVAPSNPDVVYAGWESGLLMLSGDGGATWRPVAKDGGAWVSPDHNYITAIAVSPTAPFEVYVSLSGYFPMRPGAAHLFRGVIGSNGEPAWADISGNLPNAPVNAVAVQADSLIVGTDVGLFTATRSGVSWAVLGEGLPNAAVVDVKVLPNGAVLAATHGRGAWMLTPA